MLPGCLVKNTVQELGGQGDQRGPKGLRSLKGLEGGFIDDG